MDSQALQAQITNDDGSCGKMSDPERDALVAGKKAAEERIGHLERQVRIDTEALKVELAESRDQIRALTSRNTDSEDEVAQLKLTHSRPTSPDHE